MTSLVWLRQDLRLQDNPALYEASVQNVPMIILYIYDDTINPHLGSAHKWWLHHSLQSLSRDMEDKYGLSIILRKGKAADIIQEIVAAEKISNVYWNRCYEPETIHRDEKIKETLLGQGIHAESFNGFLLFEPWEIKNQQKNYFRVFTPFFKACLNHADPAQPLSAPKKIEKCGKKIKSDTLESWDLLPTHPDWARKFEKYWTPGEKAAHQVFKKFVKDQVETYDTCRNIMSENGTSNMSPYLHWGEISSRTLWHTLKDHEPKISKGPGSYLRELVWREFSNHILYHFPRLPESCFQERFNHIHWEKDDKALHAWQKGKTGYPLVDAGMRQLWETGWIHNRARLTVGSFLTKHLLISWKTGAEWFWDTLLDGDLANNSMNWQWIAGCGVDAAPYFRIFNPVLQGKRFDPKGIYIRQWVPELANLPDKYIHAPWNAPENVLNDAGIKLGATYPEPIIDHEFARNRTLDRFGKVK